MSANATTVVDVESAAHRVLETLGRPLHERATVAALETDGIRDVDAARIAPGCVDVFELGRLVHPRCLELHDAAPPAAARPPERLAQAGWKRLARRYRRGLAYSLPMLVQGLTLAGLHVSLWGSPHLTIAQQTAIGLALVVSLIATGPAGQALTRRLYYYRYQRDIRALQRTALRSLSMAILLGIGSSTALGIALALAGHWGPATAAFCMYMALQPAMWIANAVLYAIRRSVLAATAILLPTLAAAGGLRAGLPPLVVHGVGLALADGLLAVTVVTVLRRRSRLAAPARRALPRTVLPLAVGGYAAWGLVYFALIFADRLIAWLGDRPIAFYPAYEAALQIALVPLVLTLPALEHVLVRFGELLEAASKRRDPAAAAADRRRAARTMSRHVLAVGVIYAALAGGLWVAVGRWPGWLPLGAGQLVADGRPHAALGLALAGYGCFVIALGVGSAYQLLARPWPLVIAAAVAVAGDLAIGLLARVGAAPENAAYGLLTGGLMFMVGISLIWWRQRRRLDYLWFSAS
jgi:hypothetical protein